MTKRKRYKSTLRRREQIKILTDLHYEPGNQSRSYRNVWRRWIYPELGISFRTYQRYMGIEPEDENPRLSYPSLFD